MRRIVAILLLALIIFLAVYGIFEPFRIGVNDFAIYVIGPVAFGVLSGIYLTVVAAIGIPGLWAIGIIFGLIGGITIQRLWYSGKWGVRKWAIRGATKDMGAAGVTSFDATPKGATTRPPVEETQLPTAKVVLDETEKELET